MHASQQLAAENSREKNLPKRRHIHNRNTSIHIYISLSLAFSLWHTHTHTHTCTYARIAAAHRWKKPRKRPSKKEICMKLLIECPNTAMMNAVCTCTLLPNLYIYYYMHIGIFHCKYADYTTCMHIELLRVRILLHICVKLLIACPNTAMMSTVCIWILLPNQYMYNYMYIRIMLCRHVNITKYMHIELLRVGILLHVCVKLLIACPNIAMISAACTWILLRNHCRNYHMYIKILQCRYVNYTTCMHIEWLQVGILLHVCTIAYPNTSMMIAVCTCTLLPMLLHVCEDIALHIYMPDALERMFTEHDDIHVNITTCITTYIYEHYTTYMHEALDRMCMCILLHICEYYYTYYYVDVWKVH